MMSKVWSHLEYSWSFLITDYHVPMYMIALLKPSICRTYYMTEHAIRREVCLFCYIRSEGMADVWAKCDKIYFIYYVYAYTHTWKYMKNGTPIDKGDTLLCICYITNNICASFYFYHRQTSKISRTLEGNEFFDVVRAVGAASTTSSFST